MAKHFLGLPDMTRAVCHPKRKHVKDGLCRECLLINPKTLPNKDKVARKQQRELMVLHENAKHVEEVFLEAKAILRENVPRYAELHLEAAEVAAEKGDSRPMEWALQHVKGKDAPIVEPPAKEPVSSGVRVFVGINMGGVPTDGMPTIHIGHPAETPGESV